MHVPHAMKQITLSYTAKNEQYQIEGFDDKAGIQKYTFGCLFYNKTVASLSQHTKPSYEGHKMKQTRVTCDGAKLNLEVTISLASPPSLVKCLGEFERDCLFLTLYHSLQYNTKS